MPRDFRDIRIEFWKINSQAFKIHTHTVIICNAPSVLLAVRDMYKLTIALAKEK